MKKLALSVLAAVLLLSACKKDDDAPASSFSFDGKTVGTAYGYEIDNGPDDNELLFTSISMTDTSATFISGFSVDIDTLIDGATYSFLSKDSASFDRTKNFNSAFVAYKVEYKNGETIDTTGTWLNDPTAGTVTVKKNGDSYTIGYSVQFPTSKVTGKYIGKLSQQD
jgi:hypothetical protein